MLDICFWTYIIVVLGLLEWLKSGLACRKLVSSAELVQASGLVAQNESSRLSEELSPEQEQQQLTSSLFRGLA